MDWVLGDSRAIPPRHFDVTVLTGNVVQHILDPEWPRTFLDIPRSFASVSEPDDGVITARFHNQLLRIGESVAETASFAFRHAETLGQRLAAAGFEVDAAYQDWVRTSFTPEASFMVFTARAR